MRLRKLILLTISHICVAAFGFAVGIYALPILIAPPSPSEAEIAAIASQVNYSAEFKKDLKGSDTLHWGEGTVSISEKYVTLMGELAPGPNYKLYFSPAFVETEADFEQLKQQMVVVGNVKTFKNFVVDIQPNIDPSQFNTVVVWCESFGEFISAAKYR